MATKGPTVPALYTELSRFGQNGEYDRALKTANRILAQAPDEEEAIHCKIICLLQTSKFQEALQTINKHAKLAKNLIFEKAYTQYRLNQPGEALKTLQGVSLDSKLKELKAQILYRLENYDDCFEMYRDIIKNATDDYEDEREANLAAVMANLAVDNPNKKLPQLRENTYELMYNAACQLVARSLYNEAEKKLKAVEKLCRETLEEDGASEEDIDAELGIVRCQMAYCLQMQGREKEAQALYTSILKAKPSDIGLVAIASNNSVAINREQNVFDSKKKMKSATADGVEHKLSSKQRRNIAFNQCLLTVFTNQAELFKELSKKLVAKYPEFTSDVILLQAVQLSSDGKIKDAVALLENCQSENALQMKLTAVQMLLTNGDRKEACRILETVLVDSGYKPGVIGALVTLYMADNQRDLASKVFKNAVEWYKKNQTSGRGDLSALWRQAADFHLRGGEPQVAAQSLEELLRLNPSDSKTLAQLIIAYSNFDPAKAQSLSKKLPPCSLTNSAEVDALETSNWMMGTKVIKKVTKVEASPKPGSGTAELEKKRKDKKKKRKPKLPKDYVVGSTPDPERWLPKHERTGYRKKRDRRTKEVMKGSQGAATGASDLYDMTKIAPKSSPVPNSPVPESQGPRQQQNKKFQNKKKKKGTTDVTTGLISRVLVFPPVSNFRRFLIHKTVEESFPALKTFSVGEDDARRTVVCFLSDYQLDNATASQSVKPSKRPRTMPSVGIYRPPAAREPVKHVGRIEAAAVSTQIPHDKGPMSLNEEYHSPPMSNTELEPKTSDKQRRQRRPDMAVYIPRGQRIAQEHQRKLEAMSMGNEGLELQLSSPPFEEIGNWDGEKQSRLSKNDEPADCLTDANNILNQLEEPNKPQISLEIVETSNNNVQNTEKEPQNEPEALTQVQEPEQLVVKERSLKVERKSDEKLNPDELDWDVLYDDSGECLDPSLLGQLTTAVGHVSIETPKASYDEFKHRNLDEEFPHVVEIYNFPIEFKTPDLVMVFNEFKHVGFEIKWVDDTHALGIFSNSAIVSDVLNMQHPFVKTRCLSDGTQKSKLKARRCAESLSPYEARPDTCAALARRLVTGALGVKLPTQRAEREAERKILREAREKKRLAAKQREAAWEGTFSS